MPETIRHLQAIDGRARRHAASRPAPAPAAARFTGHWEELLWDLACLGEVWLEVAGMRITAGVGHLSGEGLALRLLTDAVHGPRAARDGAWSLAIGRYCVR